MYFFPAVELDKFFSRNPGKVLVLLLLSLWLLLLKIAVEGRGRGRRREEGVEKVKRDGRRAGEEDISNFSKFEKNLLFFFHCSLFSFFFGISFEGLEERK